MATKSYVVVGPVALVDLEGGVTVYVTRGGAVPEKVKPAHLEHLIEVGLVAEGESVGGIEPSRAGNGDSLDPDAKPGTPEGPDTAADSTNGADGADDVDGDGPIPPKSASKADWVAFAVSQGANEDEANAQSKDDLIGAYGSPHQG